MFKLTQSTFALDVTVQHHLQNYVNMLEELVKHKMEVDYLITGGDRITDVKVLKDTAIKIFKEAGFVLHKRHLN